MRKVRSTNPELIKLVDFLKKQSRENKAEIWRDIAERLARPRRKYVAVNLSRLNRYTHRSETVVVPGKVLATGELDHSVTIVAFGFSGKAKEKIDAVNGKCLSIYDLIEKNPRGSNVKIIG